MTILEKLERITKDRGVIINGNNNVEKIIYSPISRKIKLITSDDQIEIDIENFASLNHKIVNNFKTIIAMEELNIYPSLKDSAENAEYITIDMYNTRFDEDGVLNLNHKDLKYSNAIVEIDGVATCTYCGMEAIKINDIYGYSCICLTSELNDEYNYLTNKARNKYKDTISDIDNIYKKSGIMEVDEDVKINNKINALRKKLKNKKAKKNK